MIITEPVAAALAYGVKANNSEGKKLCLVFDWGGGTHDVSLIEVENHNVTVLGISGDNHLGGQDVDVLLMNHCIE